MFSEFVIQPRTVGRLAGVSIAMEATEPHEIMYWEVFGRQYKPQMTGHGALVSQGQYIHEHEAIDRLKELRK